MLTFYDIDSASHAPWSPNTLKTRFAIAHIGLKLGQDYQSKLVPLSDIETLHKSKGAEPTTGGLPFQRYTLPAIEDKGQFIVDSWKIATYLDEKYPSRTFPLFRKNTLQLARLLQDHCSTKIIFPLIPLIAPRMAALLDGEAKEYFIASREAVVGPLVTQSIEGDQAKVAECWAKVTPALKMLELILKDDESGPFIQGEERTYADIIIYSLLESLRACGEHLFQKAVEIAPRLDQLYGDFIDLRQSQE